MKGTNVIQGILLSVTMWGAVAGAAVLHMDDDQVVLESTAGIEEHTTYSGSMTAEQVCGGFFAQQSTLECMRIVNSSRFLDDKAVAVCKGLFSSDDTMKCLRAVKNRSYTQSNINLCRGFFGTKELIECLETGGDKAKRKKGFSVVQVEVPVPAPSVPSDMSDRRKVVSALKQIEAGNLKTAKRLLREYLEATE